MASASGESLEKLEDMIVRAAESTAANVRAAKEAIGAVIFGQDVVVEHALVTVLSGGHALLVGVPGLAKTKLVETMGTALGLDARRVQFTPDLMPSDILGTEVLEESPGGKRSFRFIPGPVFAQLLMADEINRASPRTQSALLQAMQEQHITVAGARHDLPKPFHVLATQNPLEQEGTYPLPEAQLDRFIMEIDVDYPDLEAERKILFDTTGAEEHHAKPAMTAEDLLAAQRLVRRLPVGESVVEAILELVRSARPGAEAGEIGKLISWGPGPRASQALMLAVRARALLDGRFAPSVDDVLELAEPVLKHRMALTFAARAEGETIGNVIAQLKARIGSRMAEAQRTSQDEAVQGAVGKSRKLAARVPRLILEARRVASTVIHGLHGRRRAGPGENFWQYRRFVSGEPSGAIDWRRSARDDHLYVREREWEASHTIWIWPDRSPSMEFSSSLTEWSKLDRALVVSFALAEVLVQGGERIGIPEIMRPTANRNVIEKMAQAIVHETGERPSLPPNFSPAPFSEILLLSDFWSPIADFRRIIGQLAANGARGHVVQVVDPAEEAFPYAGRMEFIEPEGLGSVTAGRAETWRSEYQTLLANHRAALRAECEQFGWSFTVHRTDRGPTELLFAIHARMGAGAHPINTRRQPARTGAEASP